ncbi:MAG: hypothetical protein ACYTFV_12835 [Planctomycetota bacterium]|jgi:hypothetical protein
MLLVIAGRYFTFTTLYRLKTYWVLGATLAASAALVVLFEAPVESGAYTGALIEYAYGVAIFASKPNATEQGAAAGT